MRSAICRWLPRNGRSALSLLLLVGCASFTGLAQAATDGPPASIPLAVTLISAESINGITNINKTNDIGLNNRAAGPVTSAHDLSLFGILALGIIGLFWVRRHTSEL
jgi:hypothetical protein